MHEYYEKVRKDALDAMCRLIGQNVDDDCEDMERAVAYAKKHGSVATATRADSLLIDYKWAMHEIAAHKAIGTKQGDLRPATVA